MQAFGIFDPLQSFLSRVDAAAPDCRFDLFVGHARETGGVYALTHPDDCAPQPLITIALHGIHAYGHTDEVAIAEWRQLARVALIRRTTRQHPISSTRPMARERGHV